MYSWWTFDFTLSGASISISDEAALTPGKSRTYPIYAPGSDNYLGAFNYRIIITAGGENFQKECKNIPEGQIKEFIFNGSSLNEN